MELYHILILVVFWVGVLAAMVFVLSFSQKPVIYACNILVSGFIFTILFSLSVVGVSTSSEVKPEKPQFEPVQEQLYSRKQ